ncbi:MAG: response regulator transcription factor, partial [Ketobacter sp.]
SFISEIRTQLQAGTADNHTAAGQHPLDVSRSAKLESCRQLGLTEKEYEILKLLAEGLCNKKIASRSQIALTTVKWHLQNIFGKLQARNRTEAVVKAQEHSLIGH